MAGRRIVLSCGNHDHHIVVPDLGTAVELKVITGQNSRGVRELSERLSELAAVEHGDRVLDVACGISDPAVRRGSQVGASGRVLPIELSSEMVKVGRERAPEESVDNIEFSVLDADSVDVPEASFAAALCRWALMFFADLQGALRSILRALSPGGGSRHAPSPNQRSTPSLSPPWARSYA